MFLMYINLVKLICYEIRLIYVMFEEKIKDLIIVVNVEEIIFKKFLKYLFIIYLNDYD